MKWNIYPKLATFILLASLISCKEAKKDSFFLNGLNKTFRWKTDSTDRKPLCIVLCDFTTSMEKETSKEFVQQKAEDIFSQSYNKYFIKFYTVTADLDLPFFETGMITESQYKTKLGKQAIDKTKEYFADSLHNVIEDKKKDSLDNSYIIQSIEKAISLFQQNDPNGDKKNRLIIISDMLENGSSSIGHINLEDKSFKEDSILVSKYSPKNLSFSKFRNIAINVVLYSQKIKNLEQCIQFWNTVFSKLGYAGKVSYGTDIHL